MKKHVDCLTRLSAKRVAEIRWLESICRSADHTVSELYLKSDLNFDKRMRCFFLYYEDNRLIGTVSLFAPSYEEVEVSAVVHPAERNKGVFDRLMDSVKEELELYDIERILYVVEPSSESALKVVEAKGLALEHSEYLMSFEGTQTIRISGETGDALYNGDLEFSKATAADRDILLPLSQQYFPMSDDEASNWYDSVLKGDGMAMYKLVLKGRIIGSANVSFEKTSSCIFGVGIDPEMRGHGYGQTLVLLMLAKLNEEHPENEITLEVSSENVKAFHIYQKMGFSIKSQIDYYI